ncbi:MAG: sigma-70 family RNA polymerase sigma factor [Ilumatobacteraceae bacterium]
MGSRPGDAESELLKQYLDEIGEYTLLTAADERHLGETIALGRRAEQSLADDAIVLTRRERQRLQRLVDEAGKARHTFIQSNLRLVVSVARRYQGAGLGLLDLVQEGNLGLMRAVDRFDHTKGFKFSTYATWWIRQSIGRALADSSRTIRVPSHVRDLYSLIDQSTDRLAKDLDRPPTVEEVAAHSGVPAERVALARQHRRALVSLSASVGSDGETEIGDLIADDEAVAPYEAAAAALDRRALEVQLQRLPVREQLVLRRRFGLDGAPETLADIGDALNLTRERIRQIEARALGKLRHPSLSRSWDAAHRPLTPNRLSTAPTLS